MMNSYLVSSIFACKGAFGWNELEIQMEMHLKSLFVRSQLWWVVMDKDEKIFYLFNITLREPLDGW